MAIRRGDNPLELAVKQAYNPLVTSKLRDILNKEQVIATELFMIMIQRVQLILQARTWVTILHAQKIAKKQKSALNSASIAKQAQRDADERSRWKKNLNTMKPLIDLSFANWNYNLLALLHHPEFNGLDERCHNRITADYSQKSLERLYDQALGLTQRPSAPQLSGSEKTSEVEASFVAGDSVFENALRQHLNNVMSRLNLSRELSNVNQQLLRQRLLEFSRAAFKLFHHNQLQVHNTDESRLQFSGPRPSAPSADQMSPDLENVKRHPRPSAPFLKPDSNIPSVRPETTVDIEKIVPNQPVAVASPVVFARPATKADDLDALPMADEVEKINDHSGSTPTPFAINLTPYN